MNNPDMAGRVTLHFGTVSATRPRDCTARVKLQDLGGMETYWLPVGQYRAGPVSFAYWMPEVGELVLCALDEKGEQGCILSGVYSKASPPPVSGQQLLAIVVPSLTVTGHIEVSGSLTVQGPVTFEGAVTVQGSHSINGKDTVVVGSLDSGGDLNSNSGQ